MVWKNLNKLFGQLNIFNMEKSETIYMKLFPLMSERETGTSVCLLFCTMMAHIFLKICKMTVQYFSKNGFVPTEVRIRNVH